MKMKTERIITTLLLVFLLVITVIPINIQALQPELIGTTNPATNVLGTTATLHGTLTNDDGDVCIAGFEFGTTVSYGSDIPMKYVYGGGLNALTQHVIVKCNAFDLSTVKEATYNNGYQFNAIVNDSDYIYAGGGNGFNGIITKYYKTNLTKVAQVNYGNEIRTMVLDGASLYVGGINNSGFHHDALLRQYWKSNLTMKASINSTQWIIESLAVDNTYIYSGGDSDFGAGLRQYWKSNLTYTGKQRWLNGISYPHAIQLVGNYVYCGAGSTLYMLYNNNLSNYASIGNGQSIVDIALDGTYVYVAGTYIKKYWESDITYTGVQSAVLDSNRIWHQVVDNGYLYVSNYGTGAKRLYSTNLTVIATGRGMFSHAVSDQWFRALPGMDTFSFNITGLSYRTTYHYRAYVTNTNTHVTAYGDDMSFTTIGPYGSGTVGNPYEIRNCYDLNCTRDHLSAYWKVMNEIDMNDYHVHSWNSGAGFIPISTFTGHFDGQNYRIASLYINRPSSNYQGLFGYAVGADIRNIDLDDADVTGYEYIAGLIGSSHGSNVINCDVTDFAIHVNSGFCVGGLIGEAYKNGAVNTYVYGCILTGTITEADYGTYIGGVVGSSTGITSHCSFQGTISTVEGDVVGGLLGVGEPGYVDNCSADVVISGYDWTGGLIGMQTGGFINDSYSTGSISETATSYAYFGGLLGGGGGTISRSYSTCDVYAPNSDNVGGLVGLYESTSIANCYARGDATGNDYVGGLYGQNDYDTTILNCYSTGLVTGNTNVGGLIGGDTSGGPLAPGLIRNEGIQPFALTVTNCYWDTETSGQSSSVGGEGRTTAEMTYPYDGYAPPCTGLYEGWAFGTTWFHDYFATHNNGYPDFIYQSPTVHYHPPIFGTPIPVNKTMHLNLEFTWSIPINDAGGTFDWTIEWGGYQTGTIGDTNGTKTFSFGVGDLFPSRTYRIWVNATDGVNTTRAWYTFTTKGVEQPLQTPSVPPQNTTNETKITIPPPETPKYAPPAFSVPEMYQLLHADKLSKSDAEVTVMVIDSGVLPITYDNIQLNRISAIKDVSYSSQFDENGHGTWVNYAIAYMLQTKIPHAKQISYRVFGPDGSSTATEFVRALETAKAMHVDIVSISAGVLGTKDDAFAKACEDLRNNGIIVVVAAGNFGPSPSSIASPGISDSVIAVAAEDPIETGQYTTETHMRGVLDLRDDIICPWSSRGPVTGVQKPDVTAPGESIMGPWLYEERLLSGTSMATPLVSGGIALVYANNKQEIDIVKALYFWDKTTIPQLFEDSLKSSAYKKGNVNDWGSGIVQFDQMNSNVQAGLHSKLLIGFGGLFIIILIVAFIFYRYNHSKSKSSYKVPKWVKKL